MSDLLLDTHVLVWWVQDSAKLPRGMRRRIQTGVAAQPLWVSNMSLWEMSFLLN